MDPAWTQVSPGVFCAFLHCDNCDKNRHRHLVLVLGTDRIVTCDTKKNRVEIRFVSLVWLICALRIPHQKPWCGIPHQGFRFLVWVAPNLGKSKQSRRGTDRRTAAIAHSLNSGPGGWRSETIAGLTRTVCKHRDRNLGNHT